MRRILRTHLDLWAIPEVSDPALLCLTELLGNVLRHCPLTPWVAIRTRPTEHGVRIEVFDADPCLPQPPAPKPSHLAEAGRGLVLIAACADRYGYAPVVGGKCAWVEIDLPRDV